jgi:hypothetical protein
MHNPVQAKMQADFILLLDTLTFSKITYAFNKDLKPFL